MSGFEFKIERIVENTLRGHPKPKSSNDNHRKCHQLNRWNEKKERTSILQ